VSPSPSASRASASHATRPRSGSGRPALLVGPLLLLVSSAAAAESARGDEVLVDRVVAVVEADRGAEEDGEVVTLFELLVEARLLVAERARSVDVAAVEPPERLLRAVLRVLVDQILIRREAARLELASVSDEDVGRERRTVETRLGGPGSIDRFTASTGAPPELLEATIRRRATVARFVARNVALAVRVTDAEVEAAHREGGHPFEGRPLEEVRDEMEALLVARRQRQRLDEWLRDLRRRSRVRFIED
jgi:hypothetical protein